MDTGPYTKILSEIPKGTVLVAVGKKQPVDKLMDLYREGHRDFGENYVQELLEKDQQMGLPDVRWHFLGRLQRNKLNKLLPSVSCIHSVDSVDLGKAIAEKTSKRMDIFLQVNVSGELSKGGFDPGSVERACETLAAESQLRVLGLMCIPAPGDTSAFKKMQELSKVTEQWHAGRLSMGMSADYREALKNGATHIRLGTVLFGERA